MNRKDILKIAVLLALILAGLALFSHYDLYSFFLSRKKLIEFVNSFGPLSVAIFIGLQVLQVIAAPIPGEVSGFIGGYLYGPVLGTLYSTIGLTIGSLLAFFLAHWLGLPFVERVIRREVIRKYDDFVEHRGALVAFILFLIPGFPKDALSYILGLSHMKTKTFLVVCTAGRLLGTVMLSLSGSFARNEQNTAMLVVLAIGSLIVVLAYYFHDGILQWIRKRKGPPGEESVRKF